MTTYQSKIETQRIRLPGRSERAGGSAGFRPLTGFVVGGLAFVACLTIIVQLLGLPANSPRLHAPVWLVLLGGLLFGGSGLILWIRALREWHREQQCRTLAVNHPGVAAYADFPWNPQGVKKSPWTAANKALFGTLLFALFLSLFNWWAWFSGDDSLFVRGIVGLFDFILLLALFEAVRRVLAALKYGVSEVEYRTFPAYLGEHIALRWQAPKGLGRANPLHFTLRCVEEWTERTGHGRHRSETLHHDQLWGATQTLSGSIDCTLQPYFDLEFELPDKAPSTCLSKLPKRIFWELEVSAEVRGLDFDERYLVPVYTRPAIN